MEGPLPEPHCQTQEQHSPPALSARQSGASVGNEPYLRDTEGAGKCGIHRHHPEKGVWSTFQGLHHGQAVRKQ